MSDCAYGSNSSLSWRDSVKISGCAYGSSGTICQVMSIAKAFLFLVRVGLSNQSRLILFGAAVSFVRVLATATVVFSAHVTHYPDDCTESHDVTPWIYNGSTSVVEGLFISCATM